MQIVFRLSAHFLLCIELPDPTSIPVEAITVLQAKREIIDDILLLLQLLNTLKGKTKLLAALSNIPERKGFGEFPSQRRQVQLENI